MLWLLMSRANVTALSAAAAVAGFLYVQYLRSALSDARTRAHDAVMAADAMAEAAMKMKAQSEALVKSRDEADKNLRETVKRIESASDECLDRKLPGGLID